MRHTRAMTEAATCTWTGVVRGIYTASGRAARPESRGQARARAGAGLEGDRYGNAGADRPAKQITLIEVEALEAAARDYGLQLQPGESRRNIETAGVPLNHLVGREFAVGEVRVRGIKLCEPCGYLQRLTNRQVVRALRHRGGLRAEILSSGTIRVGDAIRPAAMF